MGLVRCQNNIILRKDDLWNRTPEQLFKAREPITGSERSTFHFVYLRRESEARKELGFFADIELSVKEQERCNRLALSRTLVENDDFGVSREQDTTSLNSILRCFFQLQQARR